MADYIERGDAFDAVMGQFCACSDETEAALNGAIEDIRKIPAADVRPVVFCKDCQSCNTDIAVDGWYGTCAFWNSHSVMADDYCSRFRDKDSTDMRGGRTIMQLIKGKRYWFPLDNYTNRKTSGLFTGDYDINGLAILMSKNGDVWKVHVEHLREHPNET